MAAEHYDVSIDFTLSVVLTPKPGFLGGNDVPLLTGGQMEQQAQTLLIAQNNQSDFANVLTPSALTPLDSHLQVNSIHLENIAEESATRAQLYTWQPDWQPPQGDSSWQADFP